MCLRHALHLVKDLDHAWNHRGNPSERAKCSDGHKCGAEDARRPGNRFPSFLNKDRFPLICIKQQSVLYLGNELVAI